jgi:hypothetical protein
MTRFRARLRLLRHAYEPTRGAHERCSRCASALDAVQHKAIACTCSWRLGNEQCVCRRDRDRFGYDRCVWCRGGYHCVVPVAANEARPA